MKPKQILCILAVIFTLCLFLVLSNSKPTYQDTIDPGKIIYYGDANAVIRDSVLIARVKKISEEETAYSLEHGLSDRFTISIAEIEEVFHSSGDITVTPGSNINILESQWTDEENQVVHHTEGYLKMETGKQYILLLGSNPSLNNYYPTGLLYGKIPLDPKEPLFLGDGYEDVKVILEDLRKQYG